jgi:hypothetical protein
MRRIETIERQARELGPSIAASFQSTVDGLNAAIAQLLVVETGAQSNLGPAITTTRQALATISFTVPTGYTKALVQANAVAMAYNNTTGVDYLYCVASVDIGSSGGETYNSAAVGYATSVTAPYYVQLTGLTDGETFVVAANARTNTATWGASTANLVTIYASVIFQR